MNKYSDKSDFEINKAVAIALNIDHHFHIGNECDFDCNILPDERGPVWNSTSDGVLSWVVRNGSCFNPCNNPTDAMPIVIENGISSLFNGDEWICSALDGEFLSINESLYRAAMEVFLMMKDAKNENV